MSQNEQILQHLKKGKTLTPIEALESFGSFRLASRIYDLKSDGWPIECEKIKTYNGKMVAEYALIQDRSLWPE